MEISFDGKSAIVTGGGSGIGEAICHRLAKAGAHVIVADINTDEAARVAHDIRETGATAYECTVDTSDAKSVSAMVNFAVEKTGELRYLVNNAGIGGALEDTGSYPLDSWEQVIGVNLNGVFYGMRFGLPAIEKSGGGAIVNMASILGSVGFANAVAYVAAKHGVVGMTKTAAMEYGQRGIRINSIGPGFIRTPMIDKNLSEEMQSGLAAMHPVGRMGTSEEVAELTAFLLSDQASFITGSYHLVDGGYTAQ